MARNEEESDMKPQLNTEMTRVQDEAKTENVTVDGWQEGTENIPGFATVTDKTTRTTFSVKSGEPLDYALGKAQARMAAGRRKKKSKAT